MFIQSTVRVAALIALLGAAPMPALGGDDDRALPESDQVVVSLDDALTLVRRRYPTLRIVDSEVARHGSRWVHTIRVARNSTSRIVKIDCASGAVVVDRRESARGARLQRNREEARRVANLEVSRINGVEAARIALPGATVYEVELDDLNDQPVWKVKMLDGTRRLTVLVNATTGVVQSIPGDGVVNLSFDQAVARGEELFPGWRVVKVEREDHLDFDDSGDHYQLLLQRGDGSERRDVRIDANTGELRRDRTRPAGGGLRQDWLFIAGFTPGLTFGQAAANAGAALPGAVAREVELKEEENVAVYEVELRRADGTVADVYINAATGELFQLGDDNDGGGDGGDDGSGQVNVTPAEAVAIAFAVLPGSTVREFETEIEDGALIYKVKLNTPGGGRAEVRINAATGAVVRVEDDDD